MRQSKTKQGAGNVNLEEISDQQPQREQEGHRNQARSHQRRTDPDEAGSTQDGNLVLQDEAPITEDFNLVLPDDASLTQGRNLVLQDEASVPESDPDVVEALTSLPA